MAKKEGDQNRFEPVVLIPRERISTSDGDTFIVDAIGSSEENIRAAMDHLREDHGLRISEATGSSRGRSRSFTGFGQGRWGTDEIPGRAKAKQN